MITSYFKRLKYLSEQKEYFDNEGLSKTMFGIYSSLFLYI